MKRYCFDYIGEWVAQWSAAIPKTVETIEMVPFDIFVFTSPMKDHYGETIDDMHEWLRQRHGYCVRLAGERRRKADTDFRKSPENFESVVPANK